MSLVRGWLRVRALADQWWQGCVVSNSGPTTDTVPPPTTALRVRVSELGFWRWFCLGLSQFATHLHACKRAEGP